MSEELTAEELAVVEGKDIEDEAEPIVPEAEELPVEEAPAEESAVEVKEEAPTDEVANLRKANKGILEELIKTRRSAKEDREWKQGVQQRMDLMAERLSPQETMQAPEEEPDRDADPLGWSVWAAKQNMEEVVAPIKEELDANREQQRLEEFQQDFVNRTRSAEESFLAAQEIPKADYESRLDALRLNRAKWYVATGLEPADAERATQVDEVAFIADCLQNGKNPSAEVMRMFDVLKPEIPEYAKPAQGEPGAGLDKVDAVRKGQNTDALSNVPSSGDKSVITFEQFADMPEDDPIARKIMSSAKLFSQIQIHGQVAM